MKKAEGGGKPGPAASPEGIFADLVGSGTVRTEQELRRVYTTILKRYHPDLAHDTKLALDFDRLKLEFNAAKVLLRQRWPVSPNAKAVFDRDAFLAEFRDLVARGFPINPRAVRKNKVYRSSIGFIAASLGDLFGQPDAFSIVNDQLENLRDAIPRVYWYAMQILWNSFDAWLGGYPYSLTIARRHYDCIVGTLDRLDFLVLKRLFLLVIGESRGVEGKT